MNLYGRSIPAIATGDTLPIRDASAIGTGDEAELRDVTLARLQSHFFRIVTLAGTEPTTDELPAGVWGVFQNSEGEVALWARETGGGLSALTIN